MMCGSVFYRRHRTNPKESNPVTNTGRLDFCTVSYHNLYILHLIIELTISKCSSIPTKLGNSIIMLLLIVLCRESIKHHKTIELLFDS